MELRFAGEVWHWRGPAPHHFVSVPTPEAEAIAEVAGQVSYGWGCIPVTGRVGTTRFTTSLFPKDGSYVVPLKVAVRRAEGIELGDLVEVSLTIETR